MRAFFVNPHLQQFLALGVPIAALIISLVVVYPAWGRYQEMTKNVVAQRAELQKLKDTPLPPRDPALPAANDDRDESAQFLGQIVGLTLASRCRFSGMDAAPAGETKGKSPLRPLRARIEVEGEYPQVRRLLAQIATAPRVFSILSLSLTRSAGNQQSPGLHATLEIERYVLRPDNATANKEVSPAK